MGQATQGKKSGCLTIIIAVLVIGFISEKLSCNKESNDKKNTQAEATKSELPSMTEDEYVKYFQDKWDAVKLEKEGKFPQYETYQTALEKILQDMLSVLEKDPSYKLNSSSKLNKLRLKFVDSKKMKTAISNYVTYGQPMLGDELKYACETLLKENANDPSSIDIEGYAVQRQSAKGWVVALKYRGKNAFGGLVLNVSTFDVRFNAAEKVYYAVSMD